MLQLPGAPAARFGFGTKGVSSPPCLPTASAQGSCSGEGRLGSRSCRPTTGRVARQRSGAGEEECRDGGASFSVGPEGRRVQAIPARGRLSLAPSRGLVLSCTLACSTGALHQLARSAYVRRRKGGNVSGMHQTPAQPFLLRVVTRRRFAWQQAGAPRPGARS